VAHTAAYAAETNTTANATKPNATTYATVPHSYFTFLDSAEIRCILHTKGCQDNCFLIRYLRNSGTTDQYGIDSLCLQQ
jgi:hypothetical protein